MSANSTALCAAACVAAACAHPAFPHGPGAPSPAARRGPVRTGHLPIRGLQMYFELHGEGGTPLVLLHGGGSTIDSTYGCILPRFARHRRVIALEEQAHGRTTDRDAPVRFETSADDVDALLAELGVDAADVLGFSNGASVALQVAIRHPARVRRLVFASSMTRRDGAAPEFWDGFPGATLADLPPPLRDAFLRVNPDPAQLRRMFERDVERMRSFRDVPDADVARLDRPVLIVAGDRDVPTLEHLVALTRQLPRARLAIFPGGHGDYLGDPSAPPGSPACERAAEFTSWLVEQFLDGPA